MVSNVLPSKISACLFEGAEKGTSEGRSNKSEPDIYFYCIDPLAKLPAI